MSDEEIKAELKKGLTSFPKYIPIWYKYDKEGSILFDNIHKNSPYYYLNRAEISALKEQSKDILSNLPTPCALVDLGSGSGIKTRILIDEFLRRQDKLLYMPIDISEEFLEDTCVTLLQDYEDKLEVKSVAGFYEEGIEASKNLEIPKLIIWFGSLQNNSYHRQIEYLTFIAERMNNDDRLLLSLDITMDREKILKAYLDPLGIAKTFHLNSIARLNKEEKTNIDLNQFQIEVDFIQIKEKDSVSHYRCWIRSLKEQSYFIPGLQLEVNFTENERLYLHEGDGSSCKYTFEQIHTMAEKSNMSVVNTWTDADRRVAFVCLKVSD